ITHRFEFWNFFSAEEQKAKIFTRQNLPKPDYRLVLLAGEWSSSSFWFERRYEYQTVIPLSEIGRTGIVCIHKNEDDMRNLHKELDRFWNEVPVMASDKISENIIDDKIQRNDLTPLRHDEHDDFTRINHNKEKNVLTITAEYGSDITKIYAYSVTFLFRCYCWFMATAFIFLCFAVLFFSDKIKQKTIPILNAAVERVTETFNDDELIKQNFNRLKNELNLAGNGEPVTYFVASFSCIMLLSAVSLIAGLFFYLVHCPYYVRMKIRFEDSPHRHCELTVDTWTDTKHDRSGRIDYSSFCRLIPAEPATHWLLTGHKLFDRNPVWRCPLQVVLITPQGSFPIPAAHTEEQKKIIKTIIALLKKG
ncbi:MAG: hypothetical protein LBI18_06065, partial [Planctomycetaceae bacterium]|nr:hypothetical protein [Planctomycetaceae bacterium]